MQLSMESQRTIGGGRGHGMRSELWSSCTPHVENLNQWKMRRSAVLAVVTPPRITHVSSQKLFLEAYNLDNFLAYPSSMLFLVIFGEVISSSSKQTKNMSSFWSNCTCRRCLKLAFFDLYIYVKSVRTQRSIRLSNDWNYFHKISDNLQ